MPAENDLAPTTWLQPEMVGARVGRTDLEVLSFRCLDRHVPRGERDEPRGASSSAYLECRFPYEGSFLPSNTMDSLQESGVLLTSQGRGRSRSRNERLEFAKS